ncbi:MAG: hypothetical protein ACYDCL_20935 [Myxococcales bacterium]
MRAVALAIAAAGLTGFGCGSSPGPFCGADGGPDGGADGGFHTAAHGAFPQATDAGGPVLVHPSLVTVTFPGYALQQQVQAYGTFVAGSDWLTAIGKDYGVGGGTSAQVVLPSAAPSSLTDGDVEQLLQARIADRTLPAPTAATLYLVYIPVGTNETDFAGYDDCGAAQGHIVGGYHWESTARGTPFAYAVVSSCQGQSLADLELAASHEIAEAATDPFPASNPAWGIADPKNPWRYDNSELADLCVLQTVTEQGNTLSRVWSNSAAAASLDPCQPVPAGALPYFNASLAPATLQTAPAGGTVTYQLTGWSLGPVPDWGLSVVLSPYATFAPATALDRGTLNNGETATLTVIIPPGAASGGQAGLLVYSELQAGESAYWLAAVQVQ